MKHSELSFRRRLDDHSGSVDRMSLDERGLNQLALNHAVEAFLRKWPDVENATNRVLSLHQMRTGVQYKGPGIGDEVKELTRLAVAQGLDVPGRERI